MREHASTYFTPDKEESKPLKRLIGNIMQPTKLQPTLQPKTSSCSISINLGYTHCLSKTEIKSGLWIMPTTKKHTTSQSTPKTKRFSSLSLSCSILSLPVTQQTITYHCVQLLRLMPVRAFVVLMAVLIRTFGSSAGLRPSRDGDHGPPMAMGSFLPFTPTRKFMRRVGWTKPS